MTVKVYSTPSCPYCVMAKKFLQENNIVFEDIDVARNREAAKEMIDKSGQLGVPVLDIDGTIIVGFNREAIKNALTIGRALPDDAKRLPNQPWRPFEREV